MYGKIDVKKASEFFIFKEKFLEQYPSDCAFKIGKRLKQISKDRYHLYNDDNLDYWEIVKEAVTIIDDNDPKLLKYLI